MSQPRRHKANQPEDTKSKRRVRKTGGGVNGTTVICTVEQTLFNYAFSVTRFLDDKIWGGESAVL